MLWITSTRELLKTAVNYAKIVGDAELCKFMSYTIL